MFVPVQIGVSAGGQETGGYNREIELTTRQLRAFMGAAADMTEPLTSVATDIRGEITEAFATEGTSGASGKWSVLSPAYAAWKESRGPGLPLLVGLKPTSWVGHRSNAPGEQRNANQTWARSGAMRLSLLAPLQDLATWNVSPTRMRYTPSSDIAGYHETGTSKMPPRPPVDLSITFLHTVDRQFVRWLAAIQKREGL